MGPCAVRMGPGAGWSRGCVIGGPCRRGAAGAGRRDSGDPAAAAITAATARGLGSRPPARDLGSSFEKVSVPCSRQRDRGLGVETEVRPVVRQAQPLSACPDSFPAFLGPPNSPFPQHPVLTASSAAPLGFLCRLSRGLGFPATPSRCLLLEMCCGAVGIEL